MNSVNKTIIANVDKNKCSYGIADYWHGIIEKNNTSSNRVTRIHVEVKSLSSLIKYYN